MVPRDIVSFLQNHHPPPPQRFLNGNLIENPTDLARLPQQSGSVSNTTSLQGFISCTSSFPLHPWKGYYCVRMHDRYFLSSTISNHNIVQVLYKEACPKDARSSKEKHRTHPGVKGRFSRASDICSFIMFRGLYGALQCARHCSRLRGSLWQGRQTQFLIQLSLVKENWTLCTVKNRMRCSNETENACGLDRSMRWIGKTSLK